MNHYLSSPSPLTHQLPIIQNLYYEICGIPATSSDVERFFSTCGYINSQRLSSLKPESVEESSILKKNAHVVNTFNKALYPAEPTSMLTNWLVSLPAELDSPFFGNDDDNDASVPELLNEEVSLQEATSASSASSDEDEPITDVLSDPYWSHSTCLRTFHSKWQLSSREPSENEEEKTRRKTIMDESVNEQR